MRQFNQLALSGVLLLAIVACGQPIATQSVLQINKSQSTVAQAIAQAVAPVVKDLGNKNGPSVSVSITAPTAQRAVQALQHRWTSADIKNYHVVLTNGAGAQVATLDVVPAAYNTSTTVQASLAAFTGLPANDKYTVSVQAWGLNATTPDTATSQQLNTQAAATAVFDFTENGDHNIDTVATQNVTITLDSHSFSGTANLTAQVTDATFKAPGNAIAATAVYSEPVGLTYLGIGPDVLQWGGYTPDGTQDGYFKLVMDLPTATNVKKITMNYLNNGGFFDSMGIGGNPPIVGVYNTSGQRLTANVGDPIGQLSGRVELSLVLGPYWFDGWFDPTSQYKVNVIDAADTTVESYTTQITSPHGFVMPVN